MAGTVVANADSLFEWDSANKRYVFPEKLDFQKEPFATVIPSRSVSFKVHKSEGLANSALSHHREGAKYKQVDGEWIKVWSFYEPTNCEKCQAPLDSERDKNENYWGQKTEWLRSPLHKGSHIFAPFLCLECYKPEAELADEREEARRWRAKQKHEKWLEQEKARYRR